MEQKRGPNVMKLFIRRSSQIAIPKGGGLAAGIKFFSDPEYRSKVLREAAAWTDEAIAVMKTAPDNPYGDDDEAIAAAILQEIERRQGVSVEES